MNDRQRNELLVITSAQVRIAVIVLGITAVILTISFMGYPKKASTPVDGNGDEVRELPVVIEPASMATMSRGEKVFKGSCASCHKPDKHMTGPALKGVIDRAPQPGKTWLYAFLSNEDSLIRAKDPYTLALIDHWKSGLLRHPEHLSHQEIDDLIAWIEGPHPPPAAYRAVP